MPAQNTRPHIDRIAERSGWTVHHFGSPHIRRYTRGNEVINVRFGAREQVLDVEAADGSGVIVVPRRRKAEELKLLLD